MSQSMSIASTIQAMEKVVDEVLSEIVVYRPTFGKLAGSVTAGILLERIRYYAKAKNYNEFYKFNSSCSHKDYREGDSWEEELGLTRYEFEGARNRIATKIAKGDSKKELLKVFDETGNLMPANNIVLYWRDSSNKVWYQFNEALFMAHLLKIANADLANAEIQHYLEMRKNHIPYGMLKSPDTLGTEITTETTSESNNKDSLHVAREQDAPIAELPVIEESAIEEANLDSDSQKLDIVQEAEKHLDDVGAELPKPKKQKKQSKPRPRDRLFDGIAWVCFGLDAKSTDPDVRAYLDDEGPRIGAIKKYLLSLKNKGTPEEIWEWGKWYEREHPGSAKPKVLEKFKENWLKFRQQKSDGTWSPKASNGTRFDNFSSPKPEDYKIPDYVEYT